MKKLIDELTNLIKESRKEKQEIQNQITKLEDLLRETRFEDISHYHYLNYTEELKTLQEQFKLKEEYINGLDVAREVLLDEWKPDKEFVGSY